MATGDLAQRHHPLQLHPKVAAASVGSLVGTIALWLLSLAGVNPPANVATAITGVIAATLAYFAPWMSEGNARGASDQGSGQDASVTPISRGQLEASTK